MAGLSSFALRAGPVRQGRISAKFRRFASTRGVEKRLIMVKLYYQAISDRQRDGRIPASGSRGRQAGVQTNPIWSVRQQNEANSPGRPGPRRAKCAKRTQLPEAGHRGGVSIADCRLRIADWGKTRSGMPGPRPSTSGSRGAMVRNEPNFRRSGNREAIVRNEANCPTRGTEAVSRLRIADWGLPCARMPALGPARGDGAKQTQFRGADRWGQRLDGQKM
jgi:hypothetical protein